MLKPLNRLGTQRFLREARARVRASAIALNRARSQGSGAYAARLAELEELSAAKVPALQAPGQVLLSWPRPASASGCPAKAVLRRAVAPG